MNLLKTRLFNGFSEEEVDIVLKHLNPVKRTYNKGDIIFSEGDTVESIGLLLSGMAIISSSDFWGNTSILGQVSPGYVFGEVYAIIEKQPLLINVTAEEKTEIMFMKVKNILNPCECSCGSHIKLATNLMKICAYKSLSLSMKIHHTTSKSIRERLMSFFSQCSKEAKSNSFTLNYNRQQLADYLCVDRSAMCHEMSKMKRDGLINYDKYNIILK